MGLLYCLVLSLVAGLALTAAVPVLTTQSHVCVKNGVTYNGTFHPSPCEYCHCSGGRPICAVMDCAFPQCADYEHLPGQCCPVCKQSGKFSN